MKNAKNLLLVLVVTFISLQGSFAAWPNGAWPDGDGHGKHNIEMFYKYDEIYGTEKDPRITVDFEALNSK